MKKSSSNLRISTLIGMLWKFMEKIGSQFMQIIIQILLARLILPEEYGLVGLLTIFISISDVFIVQGLTTALIQKQNIEKLDYASVFYSNILMSLVIYFILFLSAPIISNFYNDQQLIALTRVLSLNVIIGAFSAVHNAYLTRNLEFKKSFYRNIFNVLTQGVIGIFLACNGFGAWSLVFSKLSGNLVGTIVLWITVDWKPTLEFSINSVKIMFSYSSKVLATNLLNTLFNNIHSLIIGRYYNASDLGYYQRGQQIPQAIMSTVDGSMSEVLYPVFSKLQSDVGLMKTILRKSIKTSMYLILPSLFLLMCLAEPLTIVLLSEKWLPSVSYMQLACIVCMFWPLSHRNHALNALGLSKITLKLSMISKVLTLLFIFVCLDYGIYTIMIGTILASLFSTWITSYYTNKYIGYTIIELISDIIKPLCLSIFMTFVLTMISMISISALGLIIIEVLIGISIYFFGSKLLKIDSLDYILEVIINILKIKQ